MNRTELINSLFYAVILIVLVFSIAVLVWLKQRFEYERDITTQNITNLFNINLLQNPEIPKVNYNRVATIVKNYEQSFLFNQIIVSKQTADGEKVVHPWYFSIKHSNAADSVLKTFEKIPLIDDNLRIGTIYLEENKKPMQWVSFATWGMGVLLAFTLLLIASRIWTQEKKLSRTTVELAEKQNEMIRLERLALAGQLTANIIHDIRKPVLNIKHEIIDLEEALKDFSGAVSSIQNMRSQVDLYFDILRELNLERFIKAEDHEQEYVNINELIDRSINLVRYEQRDVEIIREFDPALPDYFTYQYQLIQVFSNLILNAHQAMSGKGNLTINTSHDERYLIIKIRDNGPGIPKEKLENLFEPFFSTRHESGGSGLGLFICKEIIKGQNGEIFVDSLIRRGTEFTIQFSQNTKSITEASS